MKKSMFIDFDNTKSTLQKAEAIKKAGFSHTFLWWGKDDDNRFEQVRVCEKTGLEIETAHTSFKNINSMWLDGIEGEEITDYLVKSVYEAKEFSIPVLIVHLSSSFTPPPFNNIGLSRYTRITQASQKSGVLIAFENLRRVDYLDFIMENISDESKKFCFDCGHEFLYNEGKGVLEKYAPILTSLHLHDNNGTGDDHLLPFDGKINWAILCERIARARKISGFDFPVTLEVMKANSEPDFTQKAFERAVLIEELIRQAEKKLFV